MAIKKYTIDADDSIITAISLVEDPAVESNFIALAKQPQKYIHLENEDKHLIYGCALRPDFDIYRYDDWTGEEYFITFSAKAIEKLSRKFLQQYNQNNWTVDHAEYVEGLTVAESWIKQDMEKDKSVALGLDADLPVGTWFIGCYVDSNDIWEQVKAGKWAGFSIESWVSMDEIPEIAELRKQKDTKMNKENNESLLEGIKKIIFEAMGKNVELEDATSGDTETSGETSGDTETSGETSATTEDIIEEVVDEVSGATEDTEEQADNLQEVIDGLQAQVDALTAENEELKKANQKMSKQPSASQVKVDAKKQNNGYPTFLDFASGRIHY